MRRNPADWITPDILQRSRLENTPAPDLNPISRGAGTSANVGQIGEDGSWQGFGLLDLTPLDEGDGFLLSDGD